MGEVYRFVSGTSGSSTGALDEASAGASESANLCLVLELATLPPTVPLVGCFPADFATLVTFPPLVFCRFSAAFDCVPLLVFAMLFV